MTGNQENMMGSSPVLHHLRRRALLAALGVATLALVACGGETDEDTVDEGDGTPATAVATNGTPTGGTQTQGGDAPQGETVEVPIEDGTADDVEVHAGDTVQFMNEGDAAITLSGGDIDEVTIDPGETYEHEFEEGTYDMEVDGEEAFTVTVLSALQPETQGTAVPHGAGDAPPVGTGTPGN